jgi:hypothetical protein
MDIQQTNTSQQSVMASIKLLVYIFLFLPALSYALPPEFTATYTVETYGMTVARATYRLEHKNNGITFSQRSVPIGLAAILSDVEVNETAYLSLHKDQLLLDEYHYIQKDTKKNRDVHLKIKWDDSTNDKLSGTISGVAGGDTVQLEINTPVWDTLSFQVPIMMDASKNMTSYERAVLVKGKLETYEFVTHGPEEINLSDNIIKTIKIERKSTDKNKSLFLWIAPSLHNLPIKIEKWKKGKPLITMLLNNATFPSDKKLQFKIEEDFDDL